MVAPSVHMPRLRDLPPAECRKRARRDRSLRSVPTPGSRSRAVRQPGAELTNRGQSCGSLPVPHAPKVARQVGAVAAGRASTRVGKAGEEADHGQEWQPLTPPSMIAAMSADRPTFEATRVPKNRVASETPRSPSQVRRRCIGTCRRFRDCPPSSSLPRRRRRSLRKCPGTANWSRKGGGAFVPNSDGFSRAP